VGYSFIADGIKVSLATDVGHVTDSLRENLQGSHILLLESNHDVDMLQNGRYHPALKERVAGTRGHLSNAAAGALLAQVAHDGLAYAFLGHLSEDNNLPLLAMDTVMNILRVNQVSLPYVTVASRHGAGDLVEL
jgi:phosphoribosyl 1,2-cyclic phosphodiesterase